MVLQKRQQESLDFVKTAHSSRRRHRTRNYGDESTPISTICVCGRGGQRQFVCSCCGSSGHTHTIIMQKRKKKERKNDEFSVVTKQISSIVLLCFMSFTEYFMIREPQPLKQHTAHTHTLQSDSKTILQLRNMETAI